MTSRHRDATIPLKVLCPDPQIFLISGKQAVTGKSPQLLCLQEAFCRKAGTKRGIIMGKIETNKATKRSSLLKNAYELFAEQGFAKTTIADIAKKSGLAKGTFYLYFEDKYALRDELIARKSAQLLTEAQEAISLRKEPPASLEEYLLGLIDYVLNYLQRNKMMLRLIMKNLSWGVFHYVMEKNELEKSEEETDRNSAVVTLIGFYEEFQEALKKDNYHCNDPELLLFTIIELVSSTAYSCIQYETPASMKRYLPHLHQAIHQILEGYR